MVNHSVYIYIGANCKIHFVLILNMITPRLFNELQLYMSREWRNIRIILSIVNRMLYFILLESATSIPQALKLNLILLCQIRKVSNPVITASVYAKPLLRC